MNPDIILPPYPGISLDHVHIVQSVADAERALVVLQVADVLGFDTESKPIFFKGQQSTGPHLIQLATDHEVFLFPVVTAGHSSATIKALLESPTILKVGFGLSDDHKRLHAKLGVTPQHVLDLSRALREKGQGDLGAKMNDKKTYTSVQLIDLAIYHATQNPDLAIYKIKNRNSAKGDR